MKRKSLPQMFVMASVLSDEETEAKLELPTRVDPILPSQMRAQLEAALAKANPAKAKTAKVSKPSGPPPPVVADLPAFSVTKKTAVAKRRSLAWLPAAIVLGATLGIGAAAALHGDGQASIAGAVPELAAAQPALVADPIPATPPAAPVTVAPAPVEDEIAVPVSAPLIVRTPITITRNVPQGATPPRVDPPKTVAFTSAPQQPAPGAKPAPASTDSSPKAKVDADFEAAMRAAQRANQQIDQSLR